MKIEQWSLAQLKPYANNPRDNAGAVDAVAKSIKEFGFRVPIIVDGDGVIIAGHTRLKAAEKLGLPHVPVHVANELTPEQAKAYRLADNRLAELAEWDMSLLPAELTSLQTLNFDMSLLGWSDSDLTALLAPPSVEGLVDPDSIPEPPDAAITKPGDLIILGNHRLLCGDSANGERGQHWAMASCNRPLGGFPSLCGTQSPPW